VLIDTVKHDFRGQFFCALSKALDGRGLDCLVVNHLEPDHAGCLAEVVERFKPKRIFVSPMGEKSLAAHFHPQGWPIEVAPSGTKVSVGRRTLTFVEIRMLHWPDNMLTYIPEDAIAFTSDAFGQNWATSERFADEVDRSTLTRLMAEYYANIVLPYSPVVLKTLDALAGMNLDLDMVCPDHGLIWRGRDEVAFALGKYREFAQQKPKNKAVIVYDTMWRSTEKMALAAAEGLVAEGVGVRVMSLKHNHHSAVMSEVFDAAAVLVGSPTHNNGILPLVADMLTYMKGLRPQGKIGAAFGSFGWSGECVKILAEWLKDIGMELVEPQVKVKHVPDHAAFQQCFDLGRAVGQAVKKKISG
jgi:flavorubredoxin